MRILIVKTSALGDIVHTYPAIDLLRRNFPEAEIEWVVEERHAELVRGHPHVDRIIPVATKRWRRGWWRPSVWRELRQLHADLAKIPYDLLFDLQGNCKSAYFTYKAVAKRKIGLGGWAVAEWPNRLATKERFIPPKGKNVRSDLLFVVAQALGVPLLDQFRPIQLCVADTDLQRIEALLALDSVADRSKVLLAPGSAWPNKQLDEDMWEEIIRQILREQAATFLILWGSESEHRLALRLKEVAGQYGVVVPRMSLPALQRLMSRVDLVLSMDSLPLHLCGTTSTPSLGLFGPSSAEKYRPLGKHHLALQGACPYGQQFEKRCPILRTCKTGACMKQGHASDEIARLAQSIQPPPKTISSL